MAKGRKTCVFGQGELEDTIKEEKQSRRRKTLFLDTSDSILDLLAYTRSAPVGGANIPVKTRWKPKKKNETRPLPGFLSGS